MAFANPVVGGTTLIREAIHSPNYVQGVSGWTINRDGSAEFNDALFRGDVEVSAGGDTIMITNAAGFPELRFYAAPNTDFASITGYAAGSGGGHTNHVGILVQAGPDTNTGLSSNIGLDNFGVAVTTQGVPFTLNYGDVLNLPVRSVGGRVLTAGGPVDSNSGASSPPSLIGSGTASNVPVIAGHVYMAVICVRLTASAANNRAEITLWDGTVGSGTQLGSNRIFEIPVITTFKDFVSIHTWVQGSTKTIASMSPGIARFSGSGTVTARVDNNAYALLVFELSMQGVISGL
jgi:hypothetical protein